MHKSAADRAIEVSRSRNDAGLREGDDSIRLILTDLSPQPLCQFQLHDCRHQPFIARRKLGDSAAAVGEPINHSIHADVSTSRIIPDLSGRGNRLG